MKKKTALLKEEVEEFTLAMAGMIVLSTIEKFIEQMSPFDRAAFKGYYLIDPEVFASELILPEHMEIILQIQESFSGSDRDTKGSPFRGIITTSFTEKDLREYLVRSVSTVLFLEKDYEQKSLEMTRKVFEVIKGTFFDLMIESSAAKLRTMGWVEFITLGAVPREVIERLILKSYETHPLFQTKRNRAILPAKQFVSVMQNIMDEAYRKVRREKK